VSGQNGDRSRARRFRRVLLLGAVAACVVAIRNRKIAQSEAELFRRR
jgi:hypothetical protein